MELAHRHLQIKQKIEERQKAEQALNAGRAAIGPKGQKLVSGAIRQLTNQIKKLNKWQTPN